MKQEQLVILLELNTLDARIAFCRGIMDDFERVYNKLKETREAFLEKNKDFFEYADGKNVEEI